MNRPEIESALAEAIDNESKVGIPWRPGCEMAPRVYRRWHSFSRRAHSEHPTREEQINDLAKGIEQAFDPTGLYLPPGEAMHLAQILAEIFDRCSLAKDPTTREAGAQKRP